MANVAQLTTAEYTARFNDQMSAGASAAAEAMEKLAKAADDNDGKARRTSSSLAALEARLDSGARLAQAKARADETLARSTEQLNAAVARGAITQERANQLATLATQRRDVQVASVQRQIAVEEQRNRVLMQGAVANDNVGASSGRLGQALGQAGFQVQDFATQVAMGQNALMAFGVQFAQFAGMFGTAGAIAGAGVTVAVLGAQILGLAGNTDSLADATRAVEDNYQRMNDAAERRIKGAQDEAEAVVRLSVAYGSLADAGRRAEGFVLNRQQDSLNLESGRLGDQLRGSLSGSAARLVLPRDATNVMGEDLGLAVVAPQAQALRAALDDVGNAATSMQDRLRAVAAEADTLARAGGGAASSFQQMRDKALDLLPQAAQLDDAQRRLVTQTIALMQAQGANREEIERYAARFGSLGTEVLRTATAMQRLREITLANPALGVMQEATAIQQQMDALRRGGIEALEAETRAQENNRRVTEASNRAYQEHLRQREGDEDGARAAAAQVAQETMRRNELADTLDRERKAREAADRAATEAARQSERQGEAARRDAERRQQAEEREQERARQSQQREEERAREQAAREEERALRERERQNEQTTNSIVSYAADRFADLWSSTGRGFAGLMQSMLQMVRQTFARIAAEAIIRPIVQPIVASIMGSGGAGGAGMLGGLTQLLGLSGLGSQISGALGLGGIGSGLSGLLSTPLWSGPAPALGAPLLGANGMLAGGGATSLAAPSVTLGNLIGGAGLGFGAGTLLNSLARGNQQNGMIGSAGGALAGAAIGSIIPGIGTVIGGLLGGAGGGLLGGMFGGGKGFSGGHVNIEVGEDGQLRLGTSGSKRFDMTQTLQSAQQQVDAINARLQASGLKVTGSDRFSFVGGGQGPSPDLLANAGNVVGRLQSPNANVMQALKTQTTLAGAIDAATWVSQVYDALTKINEPADAYAEQLKTINKTYDDAIAKTRELGLSEQALNDGRARAIADLEKARREQAAPAAAGMVGGLADFVSGLRFSDVSPLSPRAMFSAANDNFSALLARAQGGDFGAMSGLRGAAETLLAQGRAVEGSGAGFAALFDRVTQALGGIGALSPDDLTASVYRETQREQTEILTEQLQRLTSEVAALRQETRLNGLAPARAA